MLQCFIRVLTASYTCTMAGLCVAQVGWVLGVLDFADCTELQRIPFGTNRHVSLLEWLWVHATTYCTNPIPVFKIYSPQRRWHWLNNSRECSSTISSRSSLVNVHQKHLTCQRSHRMQKATILTSLCAAATPDWMTETFWMHLDAHDWDSNLTIFAEILLFWVVLELLIISISSCAVHLVSVL